MKENRHKYTAKRLISFFKDLVWSFLSLFIPRKPRIIFNSSHNDNFSFNSRYLFLYYREKFPQIDIRFIINSPAKRAELESEYGDYFIGNRLFKDKLYIAQASVWVTSTMETPLMGVFYSFRRYVLNLSHGVVFKRAGVCEKNSSFLKKAYYFICRTNFTHFLTTSEHLRQAAAKIYGTSTDKIIINGFPRNDCIQRASNDSRKILYAPTWRKEGKTRLMPCEPREEKELSRVLEKYDYTLYLRHHPLFEQLEELKGKLPNRVELFSQHECTDINERIHEFEGLITDYSSIFIDSLFSGAKQAFYPYDLDDFERDVGFLFSYKENIPGPIISCLDDFDTFLSSLTQKIEEKEKIKKMKSFFFDDLGSNASERLSLLLNSKL